MNELQVCPIDMIEYIIDTQTKLWVRPISAIFRFKQVFERHHLRVNVPLSYRPETRLFEQTLVRFDIDVGLKETRIPLCNLFALGTVMR